MLKYYKKRIFPFLMNKNIGRKEILDLRREILAEAEGEILEVGIGTGINLPLYPDSVTHITAIDVFSRQLPQSRIKADLYNMSVNSMDFETNTFDTVISTFSFCSIKNLKEALLEIKRVLKPNGRLLFLEHGRAKSRVLTAMQNIANPLFNVFTFGCNINRDYTVFFKEAGYVIKECKILRANIKPKVLVGHLYLGSVYKEV